ncbi:MAG TPA: YqeG family HAD IIIA-type phosphatase [Spirochaetia bacterium]|nr:YqeG family HAD IIIA-type phosphatase [Spirochaetia bacterium]
MGKYFFPDLVLPSVSHLDGAMLLERGIKGLLFDLDNTIIRRDAAILDQPAEQRLQELLAGGFRLAIVSNNGRTRVSGLARQLGVPYVSRAVKPFGPSFKRAMQQTGTSRSETAVVGDQVFTDVLGGNLLGLYTILVRPLPGKEFFGTRLISRPLERLVLGRLPVVDRETVGPEGRLFNADKR